MASAAILVGGQARRFGGVDKSALVVGGRTILDRQVEALARVADDVLIVGTGLGRMDEADVRSAFRRSEGPAEAGTHSERDVASGSSRTCRVIHDRVADSGPLGGLDAALAAARDDVLILLACDMPFVTSA